MLLLIPANIRHILIFAYYFHISVRSENSIEDNSSCIGKIPGDPSPSSSEGQGDRSGSVCNDYIAQNLSDSFGQDFGSAEPVESPMKTIPLQQYEDLIQFQSEVEELERKHGRNSTICHL